MAHKCRKKWLKYALLPFLLLTTTHADFTTECQRPCDCRWQSGNKAAICTNSSLKTIPANLSNDIQILDLSSNNLQQLEPEAFNKARLNNLKKLFVKECNIETVHFTAFATLAIMIEIDLSKNRIKHLHPDTFRSTEKLRLINLNNNFIDKLEDGLFRNLKYLQKVEVSNNRIVRIGTKAFLNLPQLKILRLDGNYLSHMKPETLMALNSLSGLDLHNNPWRCDCNLQTFRNWVISHNLYTPPTSCAEPIALREKLWNELDSTNFACRPTILEPLPDATLKSYDENVTLTCKVVGNPTPDVVWRFNSRTIETRAFGEIRYVLTDNTVDLIRWVNLTILNSRFSDKGNYTCIAENPGGRDEKTLSLILSKYSGIGTIVGMATDSIAAIIGSILSIILICASIVLFVYCTRKKSKKKIMKPTRNGNGEALIEDSMGSELDKCFGSEVNPVTKPPRNHDPPPSVTSAATEMSELNKTLLDSDPSSGYKEDMRIKDLETIRKLSNESFIFDRINQEHQAYPPDLLSFSLRGLTPLSPSGMTNDRPSPVKPQLYQNVFRQPSTSQSGSKGGYVTLPRRPRTTWVPSHHPQVFSTNGYDNFGMKLYTHTYSSLNKSDIDVINRRMEEEDLAPSPAPGTPQAAPRTSTSSPNIHNQLLALQAMSNYSRMRLSGPSDRTLKIVISPPDTEVVSRKDVYRIPKNMFAKPTAMPRKKICELREPFLCSGETVTQV